MNQSKTERRDLKFKVLDEVLVEVRSLQDSGYEKLGKWSLGQICRHLRLTFDCSIDGYPAWMSLFAPLRPIIRWLMLPRLLRGDSPKGVPTAKMMIPPGDLNDDREIALFEASVRRLEYHDGVFKPHPGFGRMERDLIMQFHSMHSAHHLGFLVPTGKLNRTEQEPGLGSKTEES